MDEEDEKKRSTEPAYWLFYSNMSPVKTNKRKSQIVGDKSGTLGIIEGMCIMLNMWTKIRILHARKNEKESTK